MASVAGVAIALYLSGLALLYLYQRDLQYHPQSVVPDPARSIVPEMSAIRIETADGMKPLAWWAPPPEDTGPVIVYFHGNGGTVASRAAQARVFLDAGYGVLLAGYRYNAGAGGRPSETGLIEDGRAAVAFVRAQGFPIDRIVVYGESMGTGVAVAIAADRAFAAVVLAMPFTSIADVAQDRYWFFPARWLVHDEFDSRARIDRLRAPLLILHGEDDRLIPVRFARELLAAAPEPKEGHFIPGGRHGGLYSLGAGERVLEFLDRWVAREPRFAG
ncbi:MAG: alpha/beta hydrolase [Rhodospirillales bacterium]|nr:MAG: alpha/beta hydrolase [Rhodospirillales bacterium]